MFIGENGGDYCMSQSTDRDVFLLTNQPTALQLETENALVDFIRRQGLSGYQAIVGAHAACWYQTINNIAPLMSKKVDEVLGGSPAENVFREKLEAARVTTGGIEKARGEVLFGEDFLPITDKAATTAAGINFLSIRKLEVSQIFRLAEHLERHEKEQARQLLIGVASAIAESMGVLAVFENDLKSLADGKPNLSSVSRQQISSNAKYHPTVSHDWAVLAQAAKESLHVNISPVPSTAAPSDTGFAPKVKGLVLKP